MCVVVYSPYVYFYQGMWYKSGILVVPFSAFDYKITKRFGFSFNYKLSASTQKGSPILSNFLVGSRVML